MQEDNTHGHSHGEGGHSHSNFNPTSNQLHDIEKNSTNSIKKLKKNYHFIFAILANLIVIVGSLNKIYVYKLNLL